MSACSNPICRSKEKAEHLCAYCKDPEGVKYCSERCADLHFVDHKCPNATIRTNRVGDTIFRPYAYEDILIQSETEIGESLDLQQRYVAVCKENGQSVQVTPVSADARAWREGHDIGYGKEPSNELLKTMPVATIKLTTDTGSSVSLECIMPRDAIYAKNTKNKRASDLAGGAGFRGLLRNIKNAQLTRRVTKFMGQHIVFWPDPMILNKQNAMFLKSDTLTISLEGTGSWIRGAYNVEGTQVTGNRLKRAVANLSAGLKGMYKIKFGKGADVSNSDKTMYDSKYLRTYMAVDNTGIMAAITFLEVEGSSAYIRLVDVEFAVPETQALQLLPEDAGKIKLPPPPVPERDDATPMQGMSIKEQLKSLDHVAAMVLVQNHLLVSGEMQEGYETACLRNYFASLEEAHTDSSVPMPAITSDVLVAADQLINAIPGGRFRRFFQTSWSQNKELARYNKFETDEQFQQEFDNLLRLAEESQAEEQSGLRFLELAEQLQNKAANPTKKHPKAYIIKGNKRLKDLQQKAKEIMKQKKQK